MARVETLVSALEATTENIRQAVALFAINRAPSTDKELLSKFTNTYAAHVFNFLRNQNSLATILALGRIWDSTESAQSVPNLLPFLKEPEILDEIVARRREAMLSIQNVAIDPGENEGEIRAALARMAERDADQAEADARKSARSLVEQIEAIINGDVLKSLHNVRNKRIGHSLQMTRAEQRALRQGQMIAPLTIRDIEPTLRETIKIVTGLNILIRDLHISLDSLEHVYSRYAHDFWDRFSGEPKGRGLMRRPLAAPKID